MIERQRPLPTLSVLFLCLAAGCAGPRANRSTASLANHPGPVEQEAETPPPAAAESPAPPPAQEAQADDGPAFDNTVLVLFGQRMLDEDEWEPTEDLPMGGINYMGRGPGGWLHWDFSVTFGDDTETALIGEELFDLSAKVWEFDLGLAVILDIGILRPYFGAGIAVVNVNAEVEQDGASFSDDSTTVGGYGRAGLSIEVTKSGGLIGVEARYLAGTDLDFAGVETDVDGLQGLVTIGFSW